MNKGAHGKRWREIYRVLRNAYVATGAYADHEDWGKARMLRDGTWIAPKPKIKLVVDNTKADDRMELLGLPLFDIAA